MTDPTPASDPTTTAATSTPSAAPPAPNHGPTTPRSLVEVPRSSIETGKFGRLFRTLPPLALTPDQITAIVNQMTDTGATGSGGWSGTPATDDADLPSGYTYLAQFVDHDITFDPISMLDQANDPDALENFRTPRFDLDCLYGLGPSATPWLYDTTDPDKILIGQNPDGFTTPDLSRNQQGRALIGDPRNDVHVIISQLHLAIARFHNRVVDLVRADPSLVTGVPATPVGGWGTPGPTTTGTVTFGQIVTLVRWHYQWIVLTQLLPRIVGPDTVALVLPRDKKGRLDPDLNLYSVRRKPWMPVEFSAAAYRFGHSLVRDAYILNSGLGALPVFSTDGDVNPLGDLRGFRRLPSGWQIEWARFFDGLPDSGPSTQHTRGFDTRLVPSLHRLPAGIDAMNRSLATLNLTRGVAVGLPSGEDVAAAVASKVGLEPASVHIDTGLPHPAPLWFWLLREAETKAAAKHLGPIGGRIVTEVLVGLAKNDPSSFLKHQPDWRPNLPATTVSDFTIADLLTITNG